MPTPTYIPLATKTLTATATSVTFSSISQAYRDLVLVVAGSLSAIDNVRYRLNGDSGSNYSYVGMQGDGSSASSAASTSYVSGVFGVFVPDSTSRFMLTNTWLDYSATNKHKTAITRGDTPSARTVAFASRWASTSAVTSIAIFSDSSQFAIGSTFTLYGIAS